MSTLNIKLYEILRNDLQLPEIKAIEFVKSVEEVIETEVEQKLRQVATQPFVKDEIHRLEIQMYKALFWTSLVQILAILGGILAIVKLIKP